ncbi:MAG: DUF6378 domain-containing protein [Pseudomonadota bacterium]
MDPKDTSYFIETAGELTAGDRAKLYGDKYENHANIARLWSAHLINLGFITRELPPHVVTEMQALLKIGRTASPVHHPDNYVDLVGYGAISGELREKEEKLNASRRGALQEAR